MWRSKIHVYCHDFTRYDHKKSISIEVKKQYLKKNSRTWRRLAHPNHIGQFWLPQ
jgi:hypothetical protein